MAGNEELTIAQAAVIVGGPSTEAARRRVERAIRDNKLAWHPGPGGTRKLIYRGDLVAWITAPSDELAMLDEGNNTADSHQLDITSENGTQAVVVVEQGRAIAAERVALTLAGMVFQLERENHRLTERAETLVERAVTAETEAAALRAEAVHSDAARQEPTQRGWRAWRWGKG